MAKTKSKPGPKPKLGGRIDAHTRLTPETYAVIRRLADTSGKNGKPIGISEAMELYIRQHEGLPIEE